MFTSRCILGMLVVATIAAALAGCGSSSGPTNGQIAFQSGSGIAVMDGDGSNQRPVVATGTQPSIRRDGRMIAFVKGNDIFTVNTDGTGLNQVTHNGIGVSVSSPAFSPSGSQIAYVVRAVAPGPVPAIHLIGTDGLGDVTLVTNADQPTFGPSGTQLAFVRDNDIFEINTDGTGITNLTNGTAGLGVSHPSFSPGGGQIVFSALLSTASLTPTIRLLALGNLQITDVIDDGTQPAFGPGGLRIAFVKSGEIFTINQSATDLQQLTSGPDDSRPSWTSSS